MAPRLCHESETSRDRFTRKGFRTWSHTTIVRTAWSISQVLVTKGLARHLPISIKVIFKGCRTVDSTVVICQSKGGIIFDVVVSWLIRGRIDGSSLISGVGDDIITNACMKEPATWVGQIALGESFTNNSKVFVLSVITSQSRKADRGPLYNFFKERRFHGYLIGKGKNRGIYNVKRSNSDTFSLAC